MSGGSDRGATHDRVAIVTGSGSGIGAATAIQLANKGWRVVVNYSKNEQGATDVAGRCKEAIVVQADVGQDSDCKRLADAALSRWGRIDALVNNAGTTKFVSHTDLDGLDAEDFLRIYRVNVVGAFQLVRAAAPALRKARGSVVNVSSLAGLLGSGSSMAYGASKAALNALTMALARALSPDVRVNAVAPGYVDTPWFDGMQDQDKRAARAETFRKNSLTGTNCSPDDVAEAIVWMIEGGRQVTGETLYVDAGMHAINP